MGGADKALLEVAGATLLDRVLAAARPLCDVLVVVGPLRPTSVPAVEFVVEEEPGGGPAAAVAAGLGVLGTCDVVLVLAVDLPLLTTMHLSALLAALEPPQVEAAAAGDQKGANPLLAAYRAPALARRAAALSPGDPARRLLPPATVTVDVGPASLNVNRPEDLAAASDLLAGEQQHQRRA